MESPEYEYDKNRTTSKSMSSTKCTHATNDAMIACPYIYQSDIQNVNTNTFQLMSPLKISKQYQ